MAIINILEWEALNCLKHHCKCDYLVSLVNVVHIVGININVLYISDKDEFKRLL